MYLQFAPGTGGRGFRCLCFLPEYPVQERIKKCPGVQGGGTRGLLLVKVTMRVDVIRGLKCVGCGVLLDGVWAFLTFLTSGTKPAERLERLHHDQVLGAGGLGGVGVPKPPKPIRASILGVRCHGRQNAYTSSSHVFQGRTKGLPAPTGTLQAYSGGKGLVTHSVYLSYTTTK